MLPVNLAIDRQRVDQNDIQVQRLLDRGDWKAAIRYIDRIMKKKSSFRLQVNRCLISLVSGDVDKTFEGLNALRKLIEAKSIMDLEIISAVDKSIPGFVLDYQPEVIMNLWKYASKAFPKDTKLMEAWFDSCCSRKDYVQASIVRSKFLG